MELIAAYIARIRYRDLAARTERFAQGPYMGYFHP